MNSSDVTIIGGSQAGLSMSYFLKELGIRHVVLERSSPGVRWRDERWDSLRLLSPNWQVALPGYLPRPRDPHGFMTAAEFGTELQKYARLIEAPLRCGVTAKRLTRDVSGPRRFRLQTSEGEFWSDSVVIATGQCAQPSLPRVAQGVPAGVHQLHSKEYRRPEALPAGGVLVVGASATGLQLAEELRQSGRDVLLAAGPHARMPRRYRGKDIMVWLEEAGVLFDRTDSARQQNAKQAAPSLQLLGSDTGRDIDLQLLSEQGIEVTGSLARFADGRALFHDDLEEQLSNSQRRLSNVLDRIDALIEERQVRAPKVPRPSTLNLPPGRTELDLASRGIHTILWATGYRADLSFVEVGARDDEGQLRHDGGVCSVSGLYLLGMNFMRHRNSSTIRGAVRDARALSNIVAAQIRKEATHAA